MNSILKFGAFVAALFMANQAFADTESFPLPEPGALPLVGLAIGVAALAMRRKK